MSKYTKRELISDSFWSKFKSGAKEVGRGAVGAAKLGGMALDVVAPELTNPIKSAAKKVGEFANTAKTALTSKDRQVIDYLIEFGYFPIGDIQWGSGKNRNNAIVDVAEVVYDDKTKAPKAGFKFKNPRLILKYDAGQVKVLKRPRRDAAVLPGKPSENA